MKKNRLVYVIVAIIIIAGVISAYMNRFAFSLAYDSADRMDVYIGKDYEMQDVKAIAEEIIGQDVLIQKVETFNDMVSITAREINEENQQAIIDKMNEKYETENTKDDITITSIPHYNGTDLLREYKLPILLSALFIVLYVIIRYRKIGSIKTTLNLIIVSIIVELLYVSIISLARIPVSFYTIPLGIVIEILTLIVLMNGYEKKLELKKEEEKKSTKIEK